jgi:hypothetical protein
LHAIGYRWLVIGTPTLVMLLKRSLGLQHRQVQQAIVEPRGRYHYRPTTSTSGIIIGIHFIEGKELPQMAIPRGQIEVVRPCPHAGVGDARQSPGVAVDVDAVDQYAGQRREGIQSPVVVDRNGLVVTINNNRNVIIFVITFPRGDK